MYSGPGGAGPTSMKRIEALRVVADVAERYDAVVTVHLGFPARELYHVNDRRLNFYMLGAMGQSCSVGLGLALCTDREVLAIEGDGGIMMNMGILPTIAQERPRNYTLVLIDNSTYATTGDQPTPSDRIDWEKVAEAHGLTYFEASEPESAEVALEDALATEGPRMVRLEVDPGNADVPLIDLNPEEIKVRFVQALREG